MTNPRHEDRLEEIYQYLVQAVKTEIIPSEAYVAAWEILLQTK